MTGPWDMTEAQRRQFREAHAEAKERAMSPQPPTKRGISALLAKAGFASAGRFGMGAGFYVHQGTRDDEVKVAHHGEVNANDPSARDEATRVMLTAYAKTITDAGWAVEAGEYELTVTAREDEQR